MSSISAHSSSLAHSLFSAAVSGSSSSSASSSGASMSSLPQAGLQAAGAASSSSSHTSSSSSSSSSPSVSSSWTASLWGSTAKFVLSSLRRWGSTAKSPLSEAELKILTTIGTPLVPSSIPLPVDSYGLVKTLCIWANRVELEKALKPLLTEKARTQIEQLTTEALYEFSVPEDFWANLQGLCDHRTYDELYELFGPVSVQLLTYQVNFLPNKTLLQVAYKLLQDIQGRWESDPSSGFNVHVKWVSGKSFTIKAFPGATIYSLQKNLEPFVRRPAWHYQLLLKSRRLDPAERVSEALKYLRPEDFLCGHQGTRDGLNLPGDQHLYYALYDHLEAIWLQQEKRRTPAMIQASSKQDLPPSASSSSSASAPATTSASSSSSSSSSSSHT